MIFVFIPDSQIPKVTASTLLSQGALMQVKQLIALSALALAGTAVLADDITPEPAPFVSTRTRAEVKAEVQQARARGELQPAGEEDVVVAAPQRSTLTRAAVKAEVLQARANGELIPA